MLTHGLQASPLRAAGSPLWKKTRADGAGTPSSAERKRKGRDADVDSDGDEGALPSVFVPRSEWKAARVTDLPEGDGRFSLQQVRTIVENAVRHRERELREEYDALLLERLDDQWRTFAKYNEDNVHAKLKESKHDYYG